MRIKTKKYRLYIIPFFILGVVGLGIEIDAQVNNVDKWNSEYNQLCSYDPLCNNLMQYNGNWKEPHEDIDLFIQKIMPYIEEVAQIYQVHPEAIAGAVIAEDTLNTSFSDELQDYLVRLEVAPLGEILGKKFTFGPGQLSLDAVEEVEQYAAAKERRKVRTQQEMVKAILEIKPSIKYIAAIMGYAQDKYRTKGINISEQPEILMTLYNTGKINKKVQRIKSENYKPRENYFGLFYRKYVKGNYQVAKR